MLRRLILCRMKTPLIVIRRVCQQLIGFQDLRALAHEFCDRPERVIRYAVSRRMLITFSAPAHRFHSSRNFLLHRLSVCHRSFRVRSIICARFLLCCLSTFMKVGCRWRAFRSRLAHLLTLPADSLRFGVFSYNPRFAITFLERSFLKSAPVILFFGAACEAIFFCFGVSFLCAMSTFPGS